MDQPLPPQDIDFAQIEDPEVGLALLAKLPDAKTAAQALERRFWQSLFTYLRDWRAGDEVALPAAVLCCVQHNRPLPPWLGTAVINKLWQRCISDDDQRAYVVMYRHIQRWEAVESVSGRHPGDLRKAIWEEAAKLVAGTDAEGDIETMRKSHALIKRAGGKLITLPSYRRAVEKRDRQRKVRRKTKKSG